MCSCYVNTLFKALFADNNNVDSLASVVEVKLVTLLVLLAVFKRLKAVCFEIFNSICYAFSFCLCRIKELLIVLAVKISFRSKVFCMCPWRSLLF